jgi:hypothetical protein
MNAAYEKLIQHLDDREIRYQSDSESRCVYVHLRGEVGSYRVVAWVDEDDELFQVFGYVPIRAPAGSRPAIAETITRANYGLKVGKFEMDYSDGDLRYQAANSLIDGHLDDETIRRFIGVTMSVLDRYLPALMSVIYGNELPEDAIRCAEDD